MLPAAFLSLPLLALKRTRGKPPAHACERVRMVTEDGQQGWDCPCRTGPHEVLVTQGRGTMRG